MPNPGSDQCDPAPRRTAAGSPAVPFHERLAAVDERWPEIAPALRRVQERRWQLVGYSLLAGVLTAAVVFLGAVAVDAHLSAGGSIFLALLPVGTIVGVVTALLGFQIADRQSAIAGRMLRIHVTRSLGLVYRHRAGDFPIRSFERNGVLPEYDRKHLEDLVYGEVSGVPMVFCDATLSIRIHKSDLAIFRGPLIMARFPKRSRSRTLVVPDGGSVGNFFRGPADGRRRVQLESPEFERAFAVFSTDQVEARYLLTPTMMERLLALYRRLPGRVTVAFTDHEFMLALDDRRDWFPDPGLFRNLDDPALAHEQAEEIAWLADIVETLKLNLQTRA